MFPSSLRIVRVKRNSWREKHKNQWMAIHVSCCKAGERNQWTTRKVFWVNSARKHSCVCRGSSRTTGIVGRRSDARELWPTTAGCEFLNTSSIVVIHHNYSMTDRVYTNYNRFTCNEARSHTNTGPFIYYTIFPKSTSSQLLLWNSGIPNHSVDSDVTAT